MNRILSALTTVSIIGIFLIAPVYAQTANNLPQEDWPMFYVDLASAIFFAATVVFMIQSNYQQKKDSKKWAEEINIWTKEFKYDEYNEVRDDHHDLIRLQIEQPELLKVFDEVLQPNPGYKKKGIEFDNYQSSINRLSKTDKQIFNFYVAEFDLYERVLDAKDENHALTDWEWTTWLLYLEKMSHHWLFVVAYNSMIKIFDPDFMEEIKEKIIDKKERAKEYLEKRAQGQYKMETIQEFADELEKIAKESKVEVDFKKFDELMMDASKNIDEEKTDELTKTLENAKQLVLDVRKRLGPIAEKLTLDEVEDLPKLAYTPWNRKD